MAKSQSKSFFFRLVAFNTLAFLISPTEAVDGQTRPKVYTCPGDHGVRYTTPNGVTFQLLCGQGTTATKLDEGKKFSQTACADWCSESPECQSCDWNAQTKLCVRFGEYIPTVPNPNVNTWFPLEEREKPAPRPDPTVFDEPKCPKNPNIIVEEANAAEFASISSQEGLCPTYDGKTYITNEGSYFKARCGHHQQNAAARITSTTAVSLPECAEFCGITPGCQSVSFHPTSAKCELFSTGESDVVPCPMADKHNAAYLIDPPTYDIKDDITIKCSTTCPGAHGQTFEENGVAFRMTCCKRHGVVPFAVEQMPSFTECMRACSMVTACASVDYHERSGQCYLGKHFGEATVVAPGWASAYSIGCAGACKKKDGCCSGCGSQTQPKSEL